jgi:ribonuclease BN (tRNA processing enzyme)
MTRVTILGSADAFHSAGRRHSAYLVECAGYALVVDFGPTALLSLRALGIDPNRLDAICLTHLHGDHIAGLPFLVVDAMYNSKRQGDLYICGPPGTRGRFDALLRAAYGELANAARNFQVHISEWPAGERTRIGPFRVRTLAAVHMDPPHVPLMLQLTGEDGKTVAFTGDTLFCPAVVECARHADLLIAECTALEPPSGRHCSWRDWSAHVSQLGAAKIVWSHLGAAVRENKLQLLREVESLGLRTKFHFAEDGDVFDV